MEKKQIHVLWIDDENETIRHMVKYLESFPKIAVTVIASLMDLSSLIEKQLFDVIIVDLVLNPDDELSIDFISGPYNYHDSGMVVICALAQIVPKETVFVICSASYDLSFEVETLNGVIENKIYTLRKKYSKYEINTMECFQPYLR